jgi:glycosyltransferase involved in cell wall biosynthesis
MGETERAASTTPLAARLEKVLVLADRFPLSGGARIDKFVKFLPDVGFEPIVLAPKETDSPRARALRVQLYPASLRCYLVGSIGWSYFTERYLDRGPGARYYKALRWLSFPERCVFVPDHMVRWVPSGLRLARQLVRREGIRVVLTSSPPESTHLIGLALKRELGVRWVADFRDLWTDKKLTYRPATPLHHRWIVQLERKIFDTADHVIANTPENLQRYRAHFALPEHKLSMIPNGFDRDDVPSVTVEHRNAGVFRIGYLGNFDKHDFPWQLFLDALKALADEVGHERVRFVICGFYSKQVSNYLWQQRMEHLIDNHGMLSHSEAMQIIIDTDLRLLLLYETAYSNAIVPAKLYNYLIMPGPILAVAPEVGATASIIAKTRTGTVFSPTRGLGGVIRALRGYYDEWARGYLAFDPDPAEIARYDRRMQTLELARLLRGEQRAST